VRPLRIRDLLTVQATDSDTVEYAAEASRTSAAAPVAEATALTGTSGTKPEGGLSFEVRTVPVRTFAVWISATKRILADASELRNYIDGYLTQDLALEVEDQVIAGDGTAENFRGILNTTGLIAVGAPGAGETAFDVLRRAIRRIRLEARTEPTAVVLHPTDAEQLDLIKVNGETGHYIREPFGSPGPRVVWGLPIVESDAIPENTGLVGDFRKAVLFDREQASITVGTVSDDFIRNIVRVLCEARAAFGVLRPKAFATVTI
jgi:HK97 family phage major capsid protein